MALTKNELKERAWVRTFAKEVVTGLREQGENRAYRRSGLRVDEAPDSDGIYAAIACVGRDEVVVLLDRFSGHERPDGWVGAFVDGRARALRIAAHMKRFAHNPLEIPARKMEINDDDVSRLKPPLKASDFYRLVVELYDVRAKGVGMYFRRSPQSSRPDRRDIDLATKVALELLSAMGGPPRPDADAAPERVELRRGQVSSRTVRDRRQASAVKQRDRYRCRVCGVQPELQYGSFGRACLDAHHVDVLGSQKRLTSDVNRMITVCAMCHRALHQLPPQERDLRALRRRFRKASVVS